MTWPARAAAALGIGIFTIRLAIDLVTVGRFSGSDQDDMEGPDETATNSPRKGKKSTD